jgi:4-aminobutyrate aminotransferase-like enzyme
MQATTGLAASQRFLGDLKRIAADNEAALIVDATETGCGAIGKGFWGFNGDTDYLVFGKRTQVEGFFSKPESKHFSSSIGTDYLKLLQFQVISETINNDRLVDNVKNVGAHLRRAAEYAVTKKKGIKGISGQGTSLFIDTEDGQTAKRLHGFLVG